MEEEIKEPTFNDKQVIVIQYVPSSMSNQLLSKFPDTSAFDFDYSQSSIWSPLVPRFHSLSCLNGKSPDLNPRLSFENNVSLPSRIKKKVSAFGLNLNSKFLKKNNTKKMLKFNGNDPSVVQPSPPSKKGWKKALKITSKQFKRKKESHNHQQQRHPISRITLADYLQCQDF